MNNQTKAKITALSLVSIMLLNGCSSTKQSFDFISGENGKLVATGNSIISNANINQYYVIEIYNNIINEQKIYIARKVEAPQARDGEIIITYYDVFTNYEIFSNRKADGIQGNDYIEFIKETPLDVYLFSYNLIKSYYTYDDMENIYETIKEDYEYEQGNNLTKKLVPNN